MNESVIRAPPMNEKIKLFGYSVKEIQNFNLLILMQIDIAMNGFKKLQYGQSCRMIWN